MFPSDCVQSVIFSGKWWVKQESATLCRGSLVFAFVPHVDQVPYRFEPLGRKDPTQHGAASVKVGPLRVDQPLKQVDLPVAAMPLHEGEVWSAYRAKRRPCLVLGCDHPAVDASLVKGMPKHSTAPTCLVAPYYGVKKSSTRAGFNPAFVERVRHAEYPQFHWDFLPFTGGEESILRLDHLQPIGTHYQSYKLSGFKLSDDAMEAVDDLISWLMWGGVESDSLIALYRAEIEQLLATK